MVLTAQPILDAVNAAKKKLRTTNYKLRTVILSPRGKQFTNKLAQSWAKRYDHLILIAGHYEGIDARVKKILSAKGVGGSAHSYGGKAEEISIGPFVLTGGELPAMVIVDAVSRHVKGVLGRADSLEDERVASKKVFTRPEVLRFKRRKYVVPKVLLGGDHRKIEEWRRKNQ
jgi:tRNA (guanine37-N1)-methyltransferase